MSFTEPDHHIDKAITAMQLAENSTEPKNESFFLKIAVREFLADYIQVVRDVRI